MEVVHVDFKLLQLTNITGYLMGLDYNEDTVSRDTAIVGVAVPPGAHTSIGAIVPGRNQETESCNRRF